MTLDLIEMPVKGLDEPVTVDPNRINDWKKLYPDMDVMHELEKARQWCLDNPSRQKTARGVNKFLSSWLGKANDSGRYKKQKTNPAPKKEEKEWVFCIRCRGNGMEYAIREEYGHRWAVTTTQCNNPKCNHYAEKSTIRRNKAVFKTHILSNDQLRAMDEHAETISFMGRTYTIKNMGFTALDYIVKTLNDEQKHA